MSALDRAAKRWGRAEVVMSPTRAEFISKLSKSFERDRSPRFDPPFSGLLQSDHTWYGQPSSSPSEDARSFCEAMASSMGTVTRVESNGLVWIDLNGRPAPLPGGEAS